MTIFAPSEARWSAVARPMPREAPVTIAIRSWRGRGVAIFEFWMVERDGSKGEG